MNTAVIQIGNSDDKLTQEEWSRFVSDIHEMLLDRNHPIHFHSCSIGSAPWQNACWVISTSGFIDISSAIQLLRQSLASLAKEYKQDSVALTLGNTEFVAANG